MASCKKPPGEGGFASITGKLYVRNYEETFTVLTSQYYAAGETVYIIYGDGQEVGNTVKTSYDGSFVFNFLRKGKYKVYALGKDSTKPYQSVPKESLFEVEITEKKQKMVLDDLVIID
ncbi:MAG: hypothetical protein JNJ40_15670 [Bacteroidia bacterium]|nr:hypothetical protein [Bacteroidia bacterium]